MSCRSSKSEFRIKGGEQTSPCIPGPKWGRVPPSHFCFFSRRFAQPPACVTRQASHSLSSHNSTIANVAFTICLLSALSDFHTEVNYLFLLVSTVLPSFLSDTPDPLQTPPWDIQLTISRFAKTFMLLVSCCHAEVGPTINGWSLDEPPQSTRYSNIPSEEARLFGIELSCRTF